MMKFLYLFLLGVVTVAQGQQVWGLGSTGDDKAQVACQAPGGDMWVLSSTIIEIPQFSQPWEPPKPPIPVPYNTIARTRNGVLQKAARYPFRADFVAVHALPNGDVLALNKNFELIRYNTDIQIVNMQRFHPGNTAQAADMIQLANGNWVILGTWYRPAFNYQRMLVICTDPLFNILWSKTYYGTGQVQAARIIEGTGNRLLVAANTTLSNYGGLDLLAACLDATNGSIVWRKALGSPFTEEAMHLQLEGNILTLTSSTNMNSAFSQQDVLVVRYDANDGEVLSNFSYGSIFNEYPVGSWQKDDNTLVVAGYTDYKENFIQMTFYEIDANTQQYKQIRRIGGMSPTILTRMTGLIFTGHTYGISYFEDAMVVTMDKALSLSACIGGAVNDEVLEQIPQVENRLVNLQQEDATLAPTTVAPPAPENTNPELTFKMLASAGPAGFSYRVVPESCPGANDGKIIYSNYDTSLTSFRLPPRSTGWSYDSMLTNIRPGTYTLEIKNFYTQCAESRQVVIPAADPWDLQWATTAATCATAADGTASLTAVGGEEPYTYYIEENGQRTLLAGNQASLLPPGPVRMGVIDSRGCEMDTLLQVGNMGWPGLGEPETLYVETEEPPYPTLQLRTPQQPGGVWRGPGIVDSLAGTLLPTHTGEYSLTYSVGECTGTHTVWVVPRVASLSIPNLLTPNGDPHNEYLELTATLGTYSLSIYDRWGNKVEALQGAQIRWTPSPTLPTGVYFYQVKYTEPGKADVEKSGSITLLR